MKYTFVSHAEVNEFIGVRKREPLPFVAILPDGKRILLRDRDDCYLPPSFFDEKPTSSGYWNFGDGVKVRQTEDGISSGSIHYDYRGWTKVEIIAPKGTQFVMDDPANEYSRSS